MPLSTLDAVPALIVIDLQQGIAGLSSTPPLGEILARIRELADAFRTRGLPVVLVNVAGRPPGRTEQSPRSSGMLREGWTDLLPELGQQASDILVTKRSWGAFAATDLEPRLRAEGVTQVVVTGVATSVGVEATARQAYELGFHVTIALDAVADLSEEAHDHSIRKVFPRIAETGATQEILSLLQNRSATA
jgi:nicotinamidase-related amidase